MVFLAEEVPRRMRRFYRQESQALEGEGQFEQSPWARGKENSSGTMEENIFDQLKEPEKNTPIKPSLQSREAANIAKAKVEEFRSRYRRFPRKDEYDQIAESIFEQLKEQEQNIKSLGIEIGETEESANPIVSLVEQQISELENSSLTDVQQKLLDWAKIDVENKDYSEALIKILDLSQK